jgi:hypothetical protein
MAKKLEFFEEKREIFVRFAKETNGGFIKIRTFRRFNQSLQLRQALKTLCFL